MRFNIYASYTSDVFTFIRLRMEAERAGDMPSVAEILFYFILWTTMAGWVVPDAMLKIDQARYECLEIRRVVDSVPQCTGDMDVPGSPSAGSSTCTPNPQVRSTARGFCALEHLRYVARWFCMPYLLLPVVKAF